MPRLAKRTRVIAAGALVVAALACRSAPIATPAWDGGPTARCPVCACEGDLACLDVKVGPNTPRASVGKQTYCFCSEDCRCRFVQHPDAYVHSGTTGTQAR